MLIRRQSSNKNIPISRNFKRQIKWWSRRHDSKVMKKKWLKTEGKKSTHETLRAHQLSYRLEGHHSMQSESISGTVDLIKAAVSEPPAEATPSKACSAKSERMQLLWKKIGDNSFMHAAEEEHLISGITSSQNSQEEFDKMSEIKDPNEERQILINQVLKSQTNQMYRRRGTLSRALLNRPGRRTSIIQEPGTMVYMLEAMS